MVCRSGYEKIDIFANSTCAFRPLENNDATPKEQNKTRTGIENKHLFISNFPFAGLFKILMFIPYAVVQKEICKKTVPAVGYRREFTLLEIKSSLGR